MNLIMSRNVALYAGLILPALETVRRILIGGHFVWWLDDYIAGIGLFLGGLLTKRDPINGRPFLAAAWGYTFGMGYMSLCSHILSSQVRSERFNGPVTIFIGLGMLLAISCLIGSLRPTKNIQKER
jgi:tellurite resistance protein TehA-like permease